MASAFAQGRSVLSKKGEMGSPASSDAVYKPLQGNRRGSRLAASPPPSSTFFACYVTLTNTLLGVSIVGTAHGFAAAGYALGAILFVVSAAFSALGLHLLAASARTVGTKPSSFYTVAKEAAPRYTLLIDLAVAVKCFGVATSYLTVVGDVMPDAFEALLGPEFGESVLLDRRFWVTAGFVVVAPMAFARTLGALKYSATLAIGFVFFLVGMVVTYAVAPNLDPCPEPLALGAAATAMDASQVSGNATAATAAAAAAAAAAASASVSLESWQSGPWSTAADECFVEGPAFGSLGAVLPVLSIFVFGFTCHQNIFTICDEMRNPTSRRLDSVIVGAVGTALVAYATLSVAAYVNFGSAVSSDVLASFPESGLLTTARICVALLVCCCYPLQAHPSRKCILSAWDACRSRLSSSNGRASGHSVCGDTLPLLGRYTPPTDQDTEDEQERDAAAAANEAAAKVGGKASAGDELGSSDRNGGNSKASAISDHAAECDIGAAAAPTPVAAAAAAEAASGSAKNRADLGSPLNNNNGSSRDQDDGVSFVGVGAWPQGSGGERRGSGDSEEELGLREGKGGGAAGQHGAGCGAAGGSDAFDLTRHLLATSLFLFASYAIAMSVTDLGVLLEVVGATGSTVISYVLPGFIYAALHPLPHWRRRLALLQLAMGCIIMPVCLAAIFLKGRGGSAPV